VDWKVVWKTIKTEDANTLTTEDVDDQLFDDDNNSDGNDEPIETEEDKKKITGERTRKMSQWFRSSQVLHCAFTNNWHEITWRRQDTNMGQLQNES
jgi:hypothetical protein